MHQYHKKIKKILENQHSTIDTAKNKQYNNKCNKKRAHSKYGLCSFAKLGSVLFLACEKKDRPQIYKGGRYYEYTKIYSKVIRSSTKCTNISG